MGKVSVIFPTAWEICRIKWLYLLMSRMYDHHVKQMMIDPQLLTMMMMMMMMMMKDNDVNN